MQNKTNMAVQKTLPRLRSLKVAALCAAAGVLANTAKADGIPDPSSVTALATTAFTGVATLSVAILTFFVVYRIVKRGAK